MQYCANVLRYETAIRTQAHEQSYPPPVGQGLAQAIAPLQQQMANMQQQTDQLRQEMQVGFANITDRLGRLGTNLIKSTRVAARAANRNIGRGELARLKIVSFADNTLPSDVQPALPLHSVSTVLTTT